VNPIQLVMPGEANWTPIRWGLKLQLAGMLLFTLGMLPLVVVLAITPQQNQRTAPPGTEWAILGAIISLGGTLVILVGLLLLAAIPAASGAARWDLGGVVCLPVIIAMLIFVLWRNGDAPVWGVSALFFLGAVVAIFFWLQSVNNILRAAATSLGDPGLSQQFRTCFFFAWCPNIAWFVLDLGYDYGPVLLQNTMRFFFDRTGLEPVSGLYPVPVLVLGLMGWHSFLIYRLLRRISAPDHLRAKAT
jgi:hypothetical protein